MKAALTDHGKILHWAGAHHLFPVRGATDNDVSFAAHGDLQGRTPIGWQAFFPVLDRTDSVVVADDETGRLALVPSEKVKSFVDESTDEDAAARSPSNH